METSLKTGFAQIFSCCPKNLSCPNFGGAAAPLAPPARTPMRTTQIAFFRFATSCGFFRGSADKVEKVSVQGFMQEKTL